MNSCCHYAHYYLGCEFRFTWPDGEWVECKLEATNDSHFVFSTALRDSGDFTDDKWVEINDIEKDGNFQLILTDTHDMTKDQIKEYKELCYKIHDLKDEQKILRYADTPLSIDYLFRNGIDAFDLIENGFAIDKNNQPEIIKPVKEPSAYMKRKAELKQQKLNQL